MDAGTSARRRASRSPGHDGDLQRPSIAAVIQCVISLRRQKVQRRAPHLGRVTPAVRHRDQEIAAARDRDADRGVPRAVGHFEIIGPDSSRHIGEPDHIARRAAAQNARSTDRDRRRDRPHRRRRRRGRNCRSRSLAAHRARPRRRTQPRRSERPCPRGQPSRGNGQAISCHAPFRSSLARRDMLIGRSARQRAERHASPTAMTSQRRIAHVLTAMPATARAAPVSSRMCRPVLARSTM